MFVVTALMIIAWELTVIMFAYIYRVIPLKNQSENAPKITLLLSSCSVIAGLVALFYLKTHYSLGIFNASKWDESTITIVMGIPFLFFLISLFGNIYRKSHVLPKEEIIFLKAEEYKIVKDFDLMMGDYMYMPNVKSYCEFSGGKIVFPISVPTHETDCAFTCRKVKDGIYECLSFEMSSDADRKIDFSRIFKIVFCVLAAIDVALVMIWISQLYLDVISRWVKGLSVSLFGVALFNLYKGAKGLLAKLMFGFSIMVIILGIASFFK